MRRCDLNYRCSFPLKVVDVSYLQECINFEILIGDKTMSHNVASTLKRRRVSTGTR